MLELAHKIGYHSDRHRTILARIMDRYRMSERKMRDRYGYLRDQEERYMAYRPARDGDVRRREERKGGKPQFTTIEIPFSYATLLTLHTYLTSIFLSRAPVFQFEGRHGEGERNVQAIEAMLDYQLRVGMCVQPLFVWLLDPGRYGFGVVGTYWDEEETQISRIEEQPFTIAGIPIPGRTRRVRVIERLKGYCGNRIYNVRPQDFFPDPRVPLNEMQRGEFVGRQTTVSRNALLREKETENYFNVEDALKTTHSDLLRDEGTSSWIPPERHGYGETARTDLQSYNLLEMTIELVPRDWGLGEATFPEKWVFVVCNHSVIVHARPFGAWHDKFPFAVLEYEMDAYQLFKRSMLEIVEPLNDALSWMFNTHIHNVRRVLNNQLIYDPSRLVGKDLRDPDPGKLIRLKPLAYGTDVRTAVHQLQVTAVTQQHVADTQIIVDLFQRVTGVSDSVMGMTPQRGRKTATEVRTSSSFAVNRLKTLAEYMSPTWGELAQMLVTNTQQYYDEEKQMRIAGDTAQMASERFLQVTPQELMGFYDYVPVDGTLPIDRFAQTNTWIQMLQVAAQTPGVMESYNWPDIFGWVAQNAGLKTIHQFKIQVTPDQMLMQQAQAGNAVPLNQPGMSPPGASPAGEPKAMSTQIPGVGPSG